VSVRVALLALCALAVGAGLAAAAGLGQSPLPSHVVYPAQTLPLSFSHARHQAREALPCTRCHADAVSSTRASDDLMPAERDCAGCHAVPAGGQPAGQCQLCHPGWDGKDRPPLMVVPTAALKHSHALHAKAGVPCADCHADLSTVGLATRAQLPRMVTCIECHDRRGVPARCGTCHPTEASGRLVTSLPGGPLVPTTGPEAHDLGFERRHATVARASGASCDSCHGERFCLDCHDGKLKPVSIHPADYARVHAVEARRNSPDCSSCHRVTTFCTGCHARTGVMPEPKTSRFPAVREGAPVGSPRFHPPGFSGQTRTAEHHAFAAQRNLTACVSCHREDFCMSCHRQRPGGPMATSPHGPAWTGSARCRTIERKNPRLCVRCHVAGRTCDQ
jgi:hypothetical protein